MDGRARQLTARVLEEHRPLLAWLPCAPIEWLKTQYTTYAGCCVLAHQCMPSAARAPSDMLVCRRRQLRLHSYQNFTAEAEAYLIRVSVVYERSCRTSACARACYRQTLRHWRDQRQTLARGPHTLEADVRLDDEADALLLHAGGQRMEVVHAQRQTEVRHLSCEVTVGPPTRRTLGDEYICSAHDGETWLLRVWRPSNTITHGVVDLHHGEFVCDSSVGMWLANVESAQRKLLQVKQESYRHRVTVDPVGARLRAVRLHQVAHQLQHQERRLKSSTLCRRSMRVQQDACCALCG